MIQEADNRSQPKKQNGSFVAVAMSGGVDSSVAALQLVQQGYKVIGITMVHFEEPETPSSPVAHGAFTSRAAKDAAAVCQHLGIPHEVIDLRQRFRQAVIEDFISEYLHGRTPNPCVLCNVTIKWGALMTYALKMGAEFFATGHYARTNWDDNRGRHLLRKASMVNKDQSYALWRLNQAQLAHTLFPLGDLSKNHVRQLAAQNHLPAAQKEESQEICFISDDNYQRFITDYLMEKGTKIPDGDIVDVEGSIVGRHRGYPFYTIGQRKGLGVAMGRPVYVTDILPEANRIVIGDQEHLLASGLRAERANWIATLEPRVGEKVKARIRYKDPGYAAILETASLDAFTLRFLEPRPAVTPGQSAVLYQDDVVLGGGIIASAIPV